MARTTTKTKPDPALRDTPEAIIAYVRERLDASPPDPNGSQPYTDSHSGSPKRRSYREYFNGSPRFPEGLKIGCAEMFAMDEQGAFRETGLRPDLSGEEIYILKCYAYNHHYVSRTERKERAVARDKRKNEMSRYGRPVETASTAEQIVDALGRIGDPKARAALAKAYAEMAESEAKEAESK